MKKKLTKFFMLLFACIAISIGFGNNQTPQAGSTANSAKNATSTDANSVPSQGNTPPVTNAAPNLAPTPIVSSDSSPSDQPQLEPSALKQFILPAMVLCFGIIIFSLIAWKHRKGNPNIDVRIESFSLIIIGVLFIISTTGSSNAQNIVPLYAPAFGLLGTIAGYILGKSIDPKNDPANTISTTTTITAPPAKNSKTPASNNENDNPSEE